MFTSQATLERRAAKEARLNAMETQIASHALLGKQLEEVKSTLKGTEDRMCELVSKVENVERRVTTEVDDKVYSISTDLHSIKQQIASMSSELSAVNQLVADTNGELAPLHRQCKENAAKFDELQKLIEAMRQEIKDMQKQQPAKQAKAATAPSFVLPPKKPTVSEDTAQ